MKFFNIMNDEMGGLITKNNYKQENYDNNSIKTTFFMNKHNEKRYGKDREENEVNIWEIEECIF